MYSSLMLILLAVMNILKMKILEMPISVIRKLSRLTRDIITLGGVSAIFIKSKKNTNRPLLNLIKQ
jgi:hypothetical protein